MSCSVAILGAGIGGAHTAYRLAPHYHQNLCIFERNEYVGGRTYDLAQDGSVPPAYSDERVSQMGALRFYESQPVIKELADELEIPYYQYDYQTSLIKARGRWFNSVNEQCAESYMNLNCTDSSDGLNAADQLWAKLLDEYQKDKSKLDSYADLNAFCRDVLGDEATDYLRDSFRFRSDFGNVNARAYMKYFAQEWNVFGTIYYPFHGMSQFTKRMIDLATNRDQARLFLNEEVLRIDDRAQGSDGYSFWIETSHYFIRAKRIVAAMDPPGWKNIRGSVAEDIKREANFQAIAPIKTVVIQCSWSHRWWEESTLYGSNIDRAWTRQNCISFIEIISRHPEQRDLNLTRTVYDDGLCVETWSNLIQRDTQIDLINEITRGLQSIFTDVQIDPPINVFAKVWPAAWHFQIGNSVFSNQRIAGWARRPLNRFHSRQLSLVGEAFNLDRSGWTDGAVKSSLFALTSQFNHTARCYEGDGATGGQFCSTVD